MLYPHSVWHCVDTDFTTAAQPIAGKPAPTAADRRQASSYISGGAGPVAMAAERSQ